MTLSYKKRTAASTYSGDVGTPWFHTPAQWNVYDCDGSHVAIIRGTDQGFRGSSIYEAYDPNTLHTISRVSRDTLRRLKVDLEKLHDGGWCGVRGCQATVTRTGHDGSLRCSCPQAGPLDQS